MIATDILEALWKQKKLIALFVAIAVLACYFCLFAGQNHTATVYIKYLEERAVEGIAADGTNLNPYEIAEPFIVEKTLAQLGKSNLNANAVAQRIKVTPVISSAEQEKYASWIDQFSNYDNTEDKKPTPVYYRIEFHSKEGVVFAQKFLNILLQQYRAHYTQQYAGISEIAQISEVVVLNADYFYATEMLQEQIENTVSYLGSIASGDVDYRSPQTGYSLNDLIDAYNLLIETKVAPTMQYILDTGVSKEVSTLVAGLRQSSNAAQRDSDENADKADTQKQMMQLYAEKNKEYVSTVISPEDYDEQIFGNVERDKAYIRNLTTYDQLMFDYVDYMVKSGDLLIDKAYINESLSKFGATSTADAPDEEIRDIYAQYASLMEITEQTLEGYNAFKSGRVLLQASGIQVTETLPELLYYVVSMILALCLGCGLVVMFALKKVRVDDDGEQENTYHKIYPFSRVLRFKFRG